MLETLIPTSSAPLAPIPPLTSRAERREAIDRELQADPRRSDHAIARIVGCDHKTVSARRREISPPDSPPTPTERRHIMIEGVKDFDAHFPRPTAEEAVDNAIAKGVTLASDQEDDGEAIDFSWNDTDAVVVPEQLATAVYRNPAGEIVIRQKRWPDDDHVVFITPDVAPRFLEKLTEIMGIPTVGDR